MISLAAWITVSMSALSKLRTTKRPRCAGGTGGAVGGGGGGGAGAASGGGVGAGGTVRGPTETCRTGGRPSTHLGRFTLTDGSGPAVGGGPGKGGCPGGGGGAGTPGWPAGAGAGLGLDGSPRGTWTIPSGRQVPPASAEIVCTVPPAIGSPIR